MLLTSLRISSHLVDYYLIPNQVSLGKIVATSFPRLFSTKSSKKSPGNDVGKLCKVQIISLVILTWKAVSLLKHQRKLLDFNLF